MCLSFCFMLKTVTFGLFLKLYFLDFIDQKLRDMGHTDCCSILKYSILSNFMYRIS